MRVERPVALVEFMRNSITNVNDLVVEEFGGIFEDKV